MADTDLEGWGIFSRALGDRLQIIADDLVATNVARLREAINRHVANAVLIKLNQVGTVTETLAAIALAQDAGWKPVISARSGETEDNFIAHLAVATNAGQLKVGSFARSERTSKWNELIRIERELGHRARYAGGSLTLG
jgi:enolase